MAAGFDEYDTASQFDECIQRCFLNCAESDYEAAVSAFLESEAALSKMKKARKLDAARRRDDPANTPAANAAREEVCMHLIRPIFCITLPSSGYAWPSGQAGLPNRIGMQEMSSN